MTAAVAGKTSTEIIQHLNLGLSSRSSGRLLLETQGAWRSVNGLFLIRSEPKSDVIGKQPKQPIKEVSHREQQERPVSLRAG